MGARELTDRPQSLCWLQVTTLASTHDGAFLQGQFQVDFVVATSPSHIAHDDNEVGANAMANGNARAPSS